MKKYLIEFKQWIFEEYPNINIEQLPDTEIIKYAQKKAINYTRCCEELKSKEEITFNKWLEVNGYYYSSYRTYENADKQMVSQAELERKYKTELSL